MKKILMYIWQLPQHLLALILFLIFYKKIFGREIHEKSTVYWLSDVKWGISLGSYILLANEKYEENTVKHEYGHSIQSMRWGPLYLLVVGLPSITMNIVSIILYKLGKKQYALDYYKRWPESEADKLGGAIR